jgi:FK506-binding protein 1
MLRSTLRTFSTTTRNMGVTKTTISEGNGPSPQKGQTVSMKYTGWLKAPGQPEDKGKVFDSTDKPGRGLFETPIGVGRVIKGEFCSYGTSNCETPKC